MANAARPGNASKFARYRTAKKDRGLKLLRIWVPDPAAPGFASESRRQADLLRGAPEEIEALDFIAAAAAIPDDAR